MLRSPKHLSTMFLNVLNETMSLYPAHREAAISVAGFNSELSIKARPLFWLVGWQPYISLRPTIIGWRVLYLRYPYRCVGSHFRPYNRRDSCLFYPQPIVDFADYLQPLYQEFYYLDRAESNYTLIRLEPIFTPQDTRCPLSQHSLSRIQ